MTVRQILLPYVVCIAALAPRVRAQTNASTFLPAAVGAGVGLAAGLGASVGIAHATGGCSDCQGVAGAAAAITLLSLPLLGTATGAVVGRRLAGGRQNLAGSMVGAFVGAGVGAALVGAQKHLFRSDPTGPLPVVLVVVPIASLAALAGWDPP